jgi:ADP-heptose:LPS heptosyltransferase/GT2 family glycosyltransferase
VNELIPLRPADLADSLPTRAFVLVHVDFPKPGELLRPGATLNGKGWVIADSDILEISIYLDETFLCYAFYGLPRPEVAEKFPHYPQAEQSGFSFSAGLGSNGASSEHRTIVVKVHTADGAVTRKMIPLAPQERTEPEPADALAAEAGSSELWPISIFVEQARIDGHGLLRVRGWVASLAPLMEVRVFLGEQQLGIPELGISRPDVGANFPHYPNASASGFELVQDVSVLQSSRCVLRIAAFCGGGIRRQVIMPIENSVSSQRPRVAQDSDIHVCCDSFSIRSEGLVSVGGWAVANAGVRAVHVALDGQEIGEAGIGLSRPDVGNQFPRIPGARQGGFNFVRRLEGELHGEHLLTVTVRDCKGSEKQVRLPLQVTARGELEVGDVLGDADNIRLEIDNPHLNGNWAAEPLRGVLTVSGWAVARGGLDRVEVQLDERSPVAAYVGVRREDVAANFPDNEAALFSGFALTIPHRLVGEGEHTVRLLIRAKSGQSAERAFQLVSEKPDETVGMIRSRLPQAEIDLRKDLLRQVGHHPVFLVLVRACGLSSTSLQKVRATLETLYRQPYSNWNAVVSLPRNHRGARATAAIVDDPKSLGRVRVQGRRREDSLTWPTTPGLAFLVTLSAGDLLGADALLELAAASALDRSTDFIYSDERCFDPAAEAVQPRLKPDWSPDMLLSTNYIGRVWCASRALVENAGITPEDLATYGEYDAVLRLTEQARSIGHVPQVLCERSELCLDSSDVERRALERAITRCGLQAEILPGRSVGSWQIKRADCTTGLVSIIIPTCAARGLISTAIRTIREKTAYPHIEIVCIDNIPAEEQAWKTLVRRDADQVLEVTETFNWSRFNNLGAAVAKGEFLLFLNDDIEARDPGWLEALLEYAHQSEVGVVGPQLLYPDGKVQHAGMFLSRKVARHAFRYAAADEQGSFGQALVQRNVMAVTGACMLMRRATFEEVGRFDEAHGVVNNDVDFCLRTWRSGLRVVYTPFATLIHHEMASRGKMADVFDEHRFQSAWGRQLAKGDSFFNPGLTPDLDDYLPEPEPVETLYPGHPLVARERVRSILAIKLDHVGDFVTALPSLRRLKERFPDAELTVLAAKASLSLAALPGTIDRCIEFNFFNARSELGQRKLEETELRELQAKLKSHRFDLAIDLRMQTDTRFMLRYTGAEVLVGFDHGGLFPWLDVAVEWEGDTRLLPKRAHVTDRLMTLVDAVDIACEFERNALPGMPIEEARARLRALPVALDAPAGFFDKPLVSIHPGVGNVMRQWPIESYAALADLLVGEEDVHILIIGGPDEAPLAREIEAAVDPVTVLSLAGRIGLAELPIVLQASVLFIGNNSGPKHISAALGVPTVGVHSGNVDAAEWGPLGSRAITVRRKVVCGPCYLSSPTECHRKLACLTGIRPADVYRACRPLLRLRSDPDN